MQFIKFIYPLCIAIFIVMGVLTLSKDYKSNINRFFCLMSFSAAAWLFSLMVSFIVDPSNEIILSLFTRLAFGFSISSIFALTVFIYLFPSKTISINHYIDKIYVLMTISLFLVSIFTKYVGEAQIIVNGRYVGDVLGSVYPLYMLHSLVSVIVCFYISIKKLLNTKGIYFKKTFIPFIGLVIFTIILVGSNVILPFLHAVNDPILIQEIVPPFSLVIIGFIYYSIYAHKSFNLSYISLNLLRWTILISVFISIFSLIDIILFHYYPLMSHFLILVICSLISLFVFEKMKKIFIELVPNSYREFRNNIDNLNAKLSFCQTYKELYELVEHTFIIKLNISNVQLFIVTDNKTIRAKSNFPVFPKDESLNALQESARKLLVLEDMDSLSSFLDCMFEKFLIHNNANICMPLHTGGKIIGLLFLGTKGDRSRYTTEEINKILEIKKNLENALLNALLRSNLIAENNLIRKIINDKTKSLKEKNREINEMLKNQQDFLAVTAHEFRTPLSIAMFQLEDSMESYSDREDMVKGMKVVESSLNDLKHLTHKLFEVQKYDLNKVILRKEKVKIKDYIADIYNDFKVIMKEKNIDFVLKEAVSENTCLNIDPDQMRQVLHNLLTNAFKFTPENGKVVVMVSCDGSLTRICVCDSGNGIMDEDKERIFEKFKTVHKEAGKGIGLGLYLCKKIIELHSGKIKANSSVLGGLEICIDLQG